MGANRRYADKIDRQMDQRILQRIAAGGPLETLTSMELHLDELTMTTDPRPSTVKAWVRFGGTPVVAEACMWTRRAVALRFRIAHTEYRCWVWTGAIEDADGGD